MTTRTPGTTISVGTPGHKEMMIFDMNLQTSGCPPNSYLRRTSTITKPSTYKKGTGGHLCHSVCISSCVWCFLDTVTIGDLKVQGYTFVGVEKTVGFGYPGKFNGILRLGCNTHECLGETWPVA